MAQVRQNPAVTENRREAVEGLIPDQATERLGAVDVCTERKSEGMQIDLTWGPIAAAVIKGTAGGWSRGMGGRARPCCYLPTRSMASMTHGVLLLSRRARRRRGGR